MHRRFSEGDEQTSEIASLLYSLPFISPNIDYSQTATQPQPQRIMRCEEYTLPTTNVQCLYYKKHSE